MTTAQPGHIVQIHCTTKQSDGKVIESTADTGPVEAELGTGKLPAPIEAALIGMAPGEQKTARATPLPPPRQELVFEVRRQDLPEAIRPRVGERLQVNYADGRSREARITRVGEATATLDANHPLAGRELVFDLKLVSIQ